MQYVFLSSVVEFKATGKRFCKACSKSQVSTQSRGMLQRWQCQHTLMQINTSRNMNYFGTQVVVFGSEIQKLQLGLLEELDVENNYCRFHINVCAATC